MIALSPYRSEFIRPEGSICLNHAGISPVPRRTAKRVADLVHYMTRCGPFCYQNLEQGLEKTRSRCARLLNAAAEQVAFTRNTSEGLCYVALGLRWHSGDEIVTIDQEFPSNLVVWLDQAKRHGLTVHQVPSRVDGGVDADALLERVTARTRVVTVSSVQFGSGAVVDLARLGQALCDSDCLLVVDAVQSLGVLPLDVGALGIDAVSAGGHKWLLSPEGSGLFFLSEKGLAQVQPRFLGWHSVANAGDYDHICSDPRPGVRRFEAGTPNFLGVAALDESVALLEQVGIAQVGQRVGDLTAAFKAGLSQRGFMINTPLDAAGRTGAGILYASHPHWDDRRLHQELSKASVEQVCRARGVRFAPHFYQDQTDVDQVFVLLDRIMEK